MSPSRAAASTDTRPGAHQRQPDARSRWWRAPALRAGPPGWSRAPALPPPARRAPALDTDAAARAAGPRVARPRRSHAAATAAAGARCAWGRSAIQRASAATAPTAAICQRRRDRGAYGAPRRRDRRSSSSRSSAASIADVQPRAMQVVDGGARLPQGRRDLGLDTRVSLAGGHVDSLLGDAVERDRQLAARFQHALLDRRRVRVEQRRRFLERQALDRDQHERGPALWRQVLQQREQAAQLLPLAGALLRRRAGRDQRLELARVDPLVSAHAAPPPVEIFGGDVEDDPVQERREPRLAAKAAQRPVDVEEDLLNEIVALRRRADHPRQARVDRIQVAPVKVGERAAIAPRRRRDQPLVFRGLGGRRWAADGHRRRPRHDVQSQARPTPIVSSSRGVE